MVLSNRQVTLRLFRNITVFLIVSILNGIGKDDTTFELFYRIAHL